jgi:RimJ/RimL family protein N-acetyltransferase
MPNPPEGIVVREACEADAGALLELQRGLDRETSMMMLEQDERTATVHEVSVRLQRISRTPNSTILVAAHGDEIVGYVEAEGGPYRRTRHSAYLVIGVRSAWHGRGLGGALLQAIERWARERGVRRLELTVRVDNKRAIRLYERAGYVTEGVRRASLLLGGDVVDELAMARLLDAEPE